MTTKGIYGVPQPNGDVDIRMKTADDSSNVGWDISTLASDTGFLAERLAQCLISVNEHDSNFEPANVVDGLYAIARAISGLTEQMLRTSNERRDAGRET